MAARIPALEVDLINDSPRVASGSRGAVEAEFTVSRPVAGVRCILRSKYSRKVKQCQLYTMDSLFTSCHIVMTLVSFLDLGMRLYQFKTM